MGDSWLPFLFLPTPSSFRCHLSRSLPGLAFFRRPFALLSQSSSADPLFNLTFFALNVTYSAKSSPQLAWIESFSSPFSAAFSLGRCCDAFFGHPVEYDVARVPIGPASSLPLPEIFKLSLPVPVLKPQMILACFRRFHFPARPPRQSLLPIILGVHTISGRRLSPVTSFQMPSPASLLFFPCPSPSDRSPGIRPAPRSHEDTVLFLSTDTKALSVAVIASNPFRVSTTPP